MNRTKYLWALLGAVVFVVATLIFNWLFQHYKIDSARGSYGDLFGFSNALFSGLAFALLIITLLMQREELGLQRKELEETRGELARTADAQERTEKALSKQIEELTHQRRFSVMPALTIEPGEKLMLSNVGNGTALAIHFRPISFKAGDDTEVNFIFKAVNLLAKDNNVELDIVIVNTWDPELARIRPMTPERLRMLITGQPNIPIYVTFTDIEGAGYEEYLTLNSVICTLDSIRRVDEQNTAS